MKARVLVSEDWHRLGKNFLLEKKSDRIVGSLAKEVGKGLQKENTEFPHWSDILLFNALNRLNCSESSIDLI